MEFGAMRALLHGSGSADLGRAWAQVLEGLEANLRHAPEITREQWLPYVVEHTRAWPASVCIAPRGWVRAAIERGAPHPLPGLARGLDALRMPIEALERAARAPGFEWVEHVSVGAPLITRRGVAALGAAAFLPHVTSLTVLDARRSLTPLASLRRDLSLTHLRLERCKADAAFLGAWFAQDSCALLSLNVNGSLADLAAVQVLTRTRMPELRDARLRHNAFELSRLGALTSASWLPGLESLEVDLRWGFRDTEGLRRWLQEAPLQAPVREHLRASWSLA